MQNEFKAIAIPARDIINIANEILRTIKFTSVHEENTCKAGRNSFIWKGKKSGRVNNGSRNNSVP